MYQQDAVRACGNIEILNVMTVVGTSRTGCLECNRGVESNQTAILNRDICLIRSENPNAVRATTKEVKSVEVERNVTGLHSDRSTRIRGADQATPQASKRQAQ